MARWGRRFPLSTQYQTLQRVVPDNPLSGAAAFQMAAVGAITVVQSVVLSETSTKHRFRSTQVPAMSDFNAVQRHLQRTLDEVARAVNPLRAVPDGGTGLSEVTSGAIMAGTGAAAMETIPIGTQHQVLISNGSMPVYSSALPVWRRFTVAYTDFSTAGTTNTKTVFALPARAVVNAAVIKHSTSFTGGAVATYTLSVGIAGTPTKYTPTLNVFAAPSNTGFAQSATGLNAAENFGASTNIIVTATSTGANLNAATQGAAEVLLFISVLPTA